MNIKKNKIQRNEKCVCGSGKKYKVCCFNLELSLEYSKNSPESSKIIKIYDDYLKKKFAGYDIIDISYKLESKNYKNYQINNFTKKIIMIAERNEKNKEVFIERNSLNGNIIIMHHGAYICIINEEIKETKKLIKQMIMGELGKQCLICFDDCENNYCCTICGNYSCYDCLKKLDDGISSEITAKGLFIKCPFCRNEKSIKMKYINLKNLIKIDDIV